METEISPWYLSKKHISTGTTHLRGRLNWFSIVSEDMWLNIFITLHIFGTFTFIFVIFNTVSASAFSNLLQVYVESSSCLTWFSLSSTKFWHKWPWNFVLFEKQEEKVNVRCEIQNNFFKKITEYIYLIKVKGYFILNIVLKKAKKMRIFVQEICGITLKCIQFENKNYNWRSLF